MQKLDTSLYFITDSTGFSEEEFLVRVERACQGGVTLLQLREKEKTTRAYIDLAEKLHRITQHYSIPLIIDDRVDVALAVDAEGVHLGQEDMPIVVARKLMGERIIGATTKTVQQAAIAAAEGADYLGVGAIYPTTTKVKTVLTPVSVLKEIVQEVSIPVNVIGGLHAENLNVLEGSGIAGVCAVSAIMKAEDPKQAVQDLRVAFRHLKGVRT